MRGVRSSGSTATPGAGLSESEDTELAESLDAATVGGYLLAVFDASIVWLAEAALPDLAAVPVEFHLRWEAVGHGYNHLGELISIRNRMGLSPF